MIIAQPLIFFRDVLFSPTRHLPYDIDGWHFPLSSVLARALRSHEWPLWDPGQYCGMPYFADIQTQMYYPPAVLALLWENAHDPAKAYYFYQWLVPIHMIIAGLLTYGLFRYLRCSKPVALYGATVFQLGAFFASQAQHLGAVCCATWLPLCAWALLMLSRQITARAVGLLSLGITLCILSGFPAAIIAVTFTLLIMAVGLTVARLASWRILVALSVSFVAAALAAMVQLAPTWVLMKLSIASLRSTLLSQLHLGPTGLPLESLVSFILPNYYHYLGGPTDLYKQPHNFTFMHTYCGLAAFLLLLFIPFVVRSKLLWISLAGMAISIVVMLGQNGHIYTYLHRLLPNAIRGAFYGEYFLISFTFFVALSATLLLKALLELPLLRTHTWIAWIMAIATGVNLLAVSSGERINSAPGSYKNESAPNSLLGDKAMLQAVRTLVNVSNPPQRIDFVNPENTELRSREELFGLQSATGDNPLMLLRFYRLRTIFTESNPWERRKPIVSLRSPWIDALNIGLLVSNNSGPPLKASEVPPEKYQVSDLGYLRLYRNTSPLARFHLVSQVLYAADEKQALTIAADPSFDPAKAAIVEGLPGDWKGGNTENSSVLVTSFSNNTITLKTSALEPLFLVSSEANYPGWFAEIDGAPAPLYQTNVAFRGLPVPAGTHTVSMRFRPEHYWLWLLVSGLTLVGIAGLVVSPWKLSVETISLDESNELAFSDRVPPAPSRRKLQARNEPRTGQVQTKPSQIPPYLGRDCLMAAAGAIVVYVSFALGAMHCTFAEADEVIFVPSLIRSKEAFFSIKIFHQVLPLMTMSYLGSIKWWLYKPIFALAGMNLTSLRLPMVLIAAATLLLLALLLRRLSGPRAALFTVLLLATDRNFLFTTTYDWGPVVLQMFFEVAALLSFVRWYDTRARIWLFVAGLAVGLGFWDKALFIWFFSSLCLTALIFAWRTVRESFSFDRLARFALGFVIGAFPLILYNIEKPNATLGQNSTFSLAFVPPKAKVLAMGVNGVLLGGFFVDPSLSGNPQKATFSTKLDHLVRVPNNGRFYLLILLVPLSLFFCRGPARAWILVLYIAGWMAWLQSAITKDAGASVHHQILFYPLWFTALGLAIAVLTEELGRIGRIGYAGLLGITAVIGLFQVNSNLADFSRFSNATQWTDAPPQLADFVRSRSIDRVYLVDWGIREPLLLASGLTVPERDISYDFLGGGFNGQQLAGCVSIRCICVGFAHGREMIPNAEKKFLDGLQGAPVMARLSFVIPDTKGAPAYDIFQILPAPAGTSPEIQPAAQKLAEPTRSKSQIPR